MPGRRQRSRRLQFPEQIETINQAANLIREFGTIEHLLENLDRLPNVKLKEKLAASRERIEQNRKMVRLELDHELPVPVPDLKIEPDYTAYIAGLKKCEFRTLLAEVEEEAKRVQSPRGELSPQGELF